MKRRLSAVCCVVLPVCMAFGVVPTAHANGRQISETAQHQEEEPQISGSSKKLVSPGNGSGQQDIVKNELNRLSDGKLYYFDSRGRKITKKGWRTLSSRKYIQIGASGYVIAKRKKYGAPGNMIFTIIRPVDGTGRGMSGRRSAAMTIILTGTEPVPRFIMQRQRNASVIRMAGCTSSKVM